MLVVPWAPPKSLPMSACFFLCFFERFWEPKWYKNASNIEPKSLPRRSWSQLGVGSCFRTPFGMIFGATMAHVLSFFVVFRCCFYARFSLRLRGVFSVEVCPPAVSFFSLRAKRRTSEKCNTLHAKTCFFKVRACAAAASTK